MGIFDTLKNAIFGSQHVAPAVANPQAAPAAPAGMSASATGQAPAGASSKAAPTPTPAPVDVGEVLTQKAAQKHETLNWQTSIVDLMKLVDLNPSLENRKALATELGYTGNMQDSASMNIWLHKEVMSRLAASGGVVPDSLQH